MAKKRFSEQQKRLLLMFVGLLLVARFVAMPHLEQREQQSQDLQMATQQLQRSLRVLDDDNLAEQVAALVAERESLEKVFLPHNSEGDFRLRAQQRIERLLAQHALQVDLFDWLGSNTDLDGYLRVHQARLTFSGRTEHAIQAQFDLLQDIPGLKVLEYSMAPQQGRIRSRVSRSRITLLLDVPGIAVAPSGSQS